MKTEAEVNRLVKEIHDTGGFPDSDLEGFDAHRETQRLDAAEKARPFGDGFQETSLKIKVPLGDSDKHSEEFTIPGIWKQELAYIVQCRLHSTGSTVGKWGVT